MIVRARGSWPIVIADLALILFLVAAAAMNRHGEREQSALLPVRAEPLATFRPNARAPSLQEWLAGQPRDDRERLTIVGRYPAGQIAAASKDAIELAFEAEAAGRHARVVLEPAARPDLVAVLAFEGTVAWHGDCSAGETRNAPGITAKDISCE